MNTKFYKRVKSAQISLLPTYILIFVGIAFAIISMFFFASKLSQTLEAKKEIDMQDSALNTLHKILNVLAVNMNNTQYKIVINASKLNEFSANYYDVEPLFAENYDFDYRAYVIQNPHNYTTGNYTEIIDINYTTYCCDWSASPGAQCCCVGNGWGVYCVNPSTGTYKCANNCGQCSAGDICFPCSSLSSPQLCMTPKKISFSDSPSDGGVFSCTIVKQIVTSHISVNANNLTISLPKLEWSFGVSQFSKYKAKKSEIAISLPVGIYTDRGIVDGTLILKTVDGELEKLYNNILKACRNAEKGLFGQMSFKLEVDYPIYYPKTMLCRRGGSVDIVFLVDTSSSMDDEWNILCDVISQIVDSLRSKGLDVRYDIYALYDPNFGLRSLHRCVTKKLTVEWSGTCDSTHGAYALGENWGPGIAWLAENYTWRATAKRIVVPISDECPCSGDPCNGNDTLSINTAINFCRKNNVVVYGLWGDGANTETINYMEQLSQATGGFARYFQTTQDLINVIYSAVFYPCKALCMVYSPYDQSCKVLNCSYPIVFENNITEAGEYLVGIKLKNNKIVVET